MHSKQNDQEDKSPGNARNLFQRQNHCMQNQQQLLPKIVGKTTMKTLKNKLDKSCPKWLRHSWSCLRIRIRVTQSFKKPSALLSVVVLQLPTGRKRTTSQPTCPYIIPHSPRKLQDESSALILITEQLRPSQKRLTLKICAIYNHLIHELPECHTPPLPPISLSTSDCPLKLPKAMCCMWRQLSFFNMHLRS